MKFLKGRLDYVADSGIFLVSLALFWALVKFVSTDIGIHAEMIAQRSRALLLEFPNFLYYGVVMCLSGFTRDIDAILNASIFVCACAVTAKFIVSKRFLSLYMRENSRQEVPGGPTMHLVVLALSCMLLLAQSIPVANPLWRMYLGYTPPNVWHNSTVIFLMPFALLLFLRSYSYLQKPDMNSAAIILILIVINIAIKPSYFFVFAVMFPIMTWRCQGWGKWLAISVALSAAGACLLAAQYVLIYYYPNAYSRGSGISVSFCGFWKTFAVHPPFNFISSLLFPFSVCAAYPSELRRNTMLQYALGSFAVAFLISCTFLETGPRCLHGNFTWQVIVCNYMLFLSTACIAASNALRQKPLPVRDRILAVIFFMHVASGIAYMVKIFMIGYT